MHDPEPVVLPPPETRLGASALAVPLGGDPESGRALVFCNSLESARAAGHLLEGAGVACSSLHGGIPPFRRRDEFRNFLSGDTRFLVCTDAAARGLDLPAVSDVILFDFPSNPSDLLHRIGRTARGGRSGKVRIYLTRKDARLWGEVKHLLGHGDREASASSSDAKIRNRSKSKHGSGSRSVRDMLEAGMLFEEAGTRLGVGGRGEDEDEGNHGGADENQTSVDSGDIDKLGSRIAVRGMRSESESEWAPRSRRDPDMARDGTGPVNGRGRRSAGARAADGASGLRRTRTADLADDPNDLDAGGGASAGALHAGAGRTRSRSSSAADISGPQKTPLMKGNSNERVAARRRRNTSSKQGRGSAGRVARTGGFDLAYGLDPNLRSMPLVAASPRKKKSGRR